MELSDIQTFAAVARTGGITRAAEELNTVQSNVTQRVKALEAEIGTPLFERHSRGMTLTGAGKRLLPYAQRMSALAREAVLAACDDGEPKGPLAIGSMETTAAVRLPPLLADFHHRFPAVRLSLRTAPPPPPRPLRLRARRHARRRLCRRSDRACRSHRDKRVPRRAGAGQRAALGHARRAACRHVGVGPDRADVPYRLHLPAAAGTDLCRVRL